MKHLSFIKNHVTSLSHCQKNDKWSVIPFRVEHDSLQKCLGLYNFINGSNDSSMLRKLINVHNLLNFFFSVLLMTITIITKSPPRLFCCTVYKTVLRQLTDFRVSFQNRLKI